MPVKATIDTRQLVEAAKRVKNIDPEIRKSLIKNLKSDLKPTATAMVNAIPANAPLSGMVHQGRTAWQTPTYAIYVSPGGGRGSIARIEIYAKAPYGAGFKLADLAGTRNSGKGVRRQHTRSGPNGAVTVRASDTSSGNVLIDRLSQRYPLSAGGKGGRFGWREFSTNLPALIDRVIVRLDEYAADIERGFSS